MDLAKENPRRIALLVLNGTKQLGEIPRKMQNAVLTQISRINEEKANASKE